MAPRGELILNLDGLSRNLKELGKGKVWIADAVKLADREICALACVDDFYDTLRADIAKVLPHVIGGVDRTIKIFGSDSLDACVV